MNLKQLRTFYFSLNTNFVLGTLIIVSYFILVWSGYIYTFNRVLNNY